MTTTTPTTRGSLLVRDILKILTIVCLFSQSKSFTVFPVSNLRLNVSPGTSSMMKLNSGSSSRSRSSSSSSSTVRGVVGENTVGIDHTQSMNVGTDLDIDIDIDIDNDIFTEDGNDDDSDKEEEEEEEEEEDDIWENFKTAVGMAKRRVRERQGKKSLVNKEAVLEYLLSKDPILPPPKFDNVHYKSLMKEQNQAFLQASNFTKEDMGYCSQVLNYVGDYCAKHSNGLALVIGWKKFQETGLIPRENCYSTYMYALGIDDRTAELCGEVAEAHDLVSAPNEKTVALRIKMLMMKNDTEGAEKLLRSLPNDDWRRLRTYTPLLRYYCDTPVIKSLLRLYKHMKDSARVYFDADAYAMILGSLAKNGAFRRDGEDTGAVELGYTHCSGPGLFNEIAQEMADDILEINNSSAQLLCNAFTEGFGINREPIPDESDLELNNVQAHADEIVADRVRVDEKTGICPRTGAKLELFQLNSIQRKEVLDSLITMAKEEYISFSNKKKRNKNHVFDDDMPVRELKNFVEWMEEREGEPFTAIVDGANVGYFGYPDFHYSNIEQVVRELESRNERPVVVIPTKYVRDVFFVSGARRMQKITERDWQVIDDLRKDDKFYEVPIACLDDYYWMIAAVVNQTKAESPVDLTVSVENEEGRFPGARPILVTVDKMRDHKLELMAPRLFRRFYSCHIVNYFIPPHNESEWEPRPTTLFPADIFSREIQGNKAPDDDSLVWHIPVTEWGEHERLSIRIP